MWLVFYGANCWNELSYEMSLHMFLFFIILLGHPGCVCVVWVKECNAVQINSLVLDGQNNVSLYVAAGVSVSFI